jgi:hypothetical protein
MHDLVVTEVQMWAGTRDSEEGRLCPCSLMMFPRDVIKFFGRHAWLDHRFYSRMNVGDEMAAASIFMNLGFVLDGHHAEVSPAAAAVRSMMAATTSSVTSSIGRRRRCAHYSAFCVAVHERRGLQFIQIKPLCNRLWRVVCTLDDLSTVESQTPVVSVDRIRRCTRALNRADAPAEETLVSVSRAHVDGDGDGNPSPRRASISSSAWACAAVRGNRRRVRRDR